MASPMQRLTAEQKRIRRYRIERNRLVGKITAEDRGMTSAEALRQAVAILRGKRGKPKR